MRITQDIGIDTPTPLGDNRADPASAWEKLKEPMGNPGDSQTSN
jgi:hypothetical protein